MDFKLAGLVLLVWVSGCKTLKPDARHPEKNGALVLSMERTPCFGRCPIYQVKLYENGLLIYDAQKFTDTTGCFYRVLSKQQLNQIKNRFAAAGFFSMANTYPEDVKTPTDLPSCIVYFSDGKKDKTVTDKRWKTPEALTSLELQIDSLINFKNLQFCDK